MKSFLSAIIAFVCVALVPIPSQANTNNSIIKIFATSTAYDYPWSVSGVKNATGSGCLIPGNRILTNAHVVILSSREHKATENILLNSYEIESPANIR
jgi:V8-like Glu-specific endopeptidase